jgi:hypothetical protein
VSGVLAESASRIEARVSTVIACCKSVGFTVMERRQIQRVAVHAFEKSAYWHVYTHVEFRTMLVAR